MKKLTLVSLILSMILISCKERGEVRIMPEFNYDQTTINISKNEGSSVTALIIRRRVRLPPSIRQTGSR